jgi:hypothetical protein
MEEKAATVNGASVTIGVKDGTVTVDSATVTTDIKTRTGDSHHWLCRSPQIGVQIVYLRIDSPDAGLQEM